MNSGAVTDGAVVRQQGVRAVDALGAEGHHGPGAGPLEDLDALRAESGAGHQDGHGAQFGPGTGGFVTLEADRAVLHDRVVEAAEGRLEFVEEAVVEGAHRDRGGGHQDHPAVPGAQAAGGRVGHVPQFPRGFADAAARRLTDPYGAGVVEDVGDGRTRDAGQPGHIGARGHGARRGRSGRGRFRYLHHDRPHLGREAGAGGGRGNVFHFRTIAPRVRTGASAAEHGGQAHGRRTRGGHAHHWSAPVRRRHAVTNMLVTNTDLTNLFVTNMFVTIGA